MTTTKAQQKANRKWNENNLERIYVTVKKGNKEIIQNLAKEHGESTNAYIINAVKERALRESNITLD